MNEIFDYFEEVADANAKAAIARPGDRRLAINAIMTLDGFFGTLHTELFELGIVPEKLDADWKETLGSDCQYYRVLRDTAYALKHGTLKYKKPRLVRRSDQLVKRRGAFQSNAFQASAFHTDRVWIEAEDNDYEAYKVIKTVLALASELLAKVPR
jgi:hypothetical protein